MKHAPAFLALVESVMPRIKEISADETRALTDAILIDVREESEFAAGHAKGAIHLGRGVIERDIENTAPDKQTKIILYCGGGYRSALAADNLQKMGYTNIYSMTGGWRSWCERGYPRT